MTLRVLQVLHQGGGAGSVTSTLHLSLGLARAGVAVRFVCPPGSEVEGRARAAGLEVVPVPLVSRGRRANAAALAGVLAGRPVDLVSSQSARDRQALTWLGLRGRLSAPLVVTRRQMPRTFFLENWVTSRVASRVIAVRPAVAAALERRGTPAARLEVVPNGLVTDRVDAPVATEAVAEWRARIGWTGEQRTIGIISRAKDQMVVLRALSLVRTPVRLVLAGIEADGPIARAAREVAPPHAAVVIPFTEEVRPLYELLEAVLLPSRIEGLSQALLEAMALGKPVLASDAGGNPDLITAEVDGLLVPALDAAAWAEAIDRVLGAPALAARLGGAARHTARETFSLDRTVARTLAVYHSVLGSPLARPPQAG
jgi:glycosyltransferase involved in cell wall biosynthesis